MIETIEYLNKDRKINSTFIKKLEKVGLEIQYGKYSYWDGQEYIQIGRKRIWLVEEYYFGNSTGIRYRYQNDVIEEIYETIEEEIKQTGKADETVENFFKKFSS